MLQKYKKFIINNSSTFITEQIKKDTFYSKNNVNIRISGVDNSLGNVISCSGNISEITNLNAGKLVGKNIGLILPNCFGVYHNNFIRSYKETGIGTMINNNNFLFCKHQNGHLVPVNINISIYPILDCGLMFLGNIRTIKTSYEYILIGQDGEIQGMTLEISKDLNFKPEDKINFCSLLNLNRQQHKYNNKKLLIEPNPSVNFNTQSVPITKLEYMSSNPVIEKKRAIFSYEKSDSQFEFSFSQQSTFIFQNFADDYLGDYAKNGRRLILKTISNHNSQKTNEDDLTNCKYFEYIAFLEKDHYKFGLQIYKLKLSKCDIISIKLNSKSSNTKTQLKTINFQDDATIQEYKEEYSPLQVNQPFAHKPEFLRESYFDSNNKPNFLVKKKVSASLKSQNKDKISVQSIKTMMPKIYNIADKNSNFQDESCFKKETIIFQSNFLEENIVKKESITSHNEFNLGSDIDGSYSIKNLYFNNNTKIKSQIHKKKNKKISKQLFTFRSFFLETNTFLTIVLFLLSICSIFIIYNISITNISKIDANLMVSYHCNQRLSNLIEIDRRLRYVWLVRANLVSDQRQAWRNITSHSANSIKRANEASQYFIGNDSVILNEIQYIDVEYQNDFYSQLVKLYSVDSSGQILSNFTETNSFIAGYEIYQAFVLLKKLPVQQITLNNTDLLFILRNSLNDIYIEYERSSQILVNQIDSLISNIEKISCIIFMIVFIISLICLILVMPGFSVLFYKKKSLLMQIININLQYCQSYAYRLNQLFKGLEENYSDAEFLNLYEENKSFESDIGSKKLDDQNNKKLAGNPKRRSNTFGIKLDLTKSFLIILLISTTYIIIFYINMIMIAAYMDNVNTAIQRVLFSTTMIAQQNFAMTIVYEFIAENGTTTVKNKPIQEAINKTMPIIANLENFLTHFRDQKGELDQNLEFIMVGNVCTILIPAYVNECVMIADGPGQNGISSLNSYAYQALNTALMIFENSARTIIDANDTFALNYLVYLEGIFYRITTSAYGYLYTQLLEQLDNEISSFKAFSLSWTLISFFSLLVLGIVVWIPINRKIANEIMSMKRIMKIIPKSIIERSKFYKMT